MQQNQRQTVALKSSTSMCAQRRRQVSSTQVRLKCTAGSNTNHHRAIDRLRRLLFERRRARRSQAGWRATVSLANSALRCAAVVMRLSWSFVSPLWRPALSVSELGHTSALCDYGMAHAVVLCDFTSSACWASFQLNLMNKNHFSDTRSAASS